MTAQRPTIKEVAAHAGVSPTTVSRVLNKRGYLSEETVSAVYAAMEEIGYRPNALARGLRVQKSEEVGVLMPTLRDPFYAELTSELENALASRGYRMLVGSTHKDPEREVNYLDLLHSSRVAGILSSSHTDVLRDYAHLALPVVTLDRGTSPTVPNVTCDNGQAARQVAALLAAGGARHPIMLTSTSDPHHPRQREFVQWWAERGTKVIVVPLGFGRPRAEQVREVGEAMEAARREGIDAVFATNDVFGGAIVNWAAEQGISVPDELQVVGFDGTEMMQSLIPRLTTVVQPLAEMGRVAVDVLLSLAKWQEEHLDAKSVGASSVAAASGLVSADAGRGAGAGHAGGKTQARSQSAAFSAARPGSGNKRSKGNNAAARSGRLSEWNRELAPLGRTCAGEGLEFLLPASLRLSSSTRATAVPVE